MSGQGLHWITMAAGSYCSGRYRITRLSDEWTLSVYEVEDSRHGTLGAAKTRAAAIETARLAGDDLFWGGRRRFYHSGGRRRNPKGWSAR
jgi:hypothetical protein